MPVRHGFRNAGRWVLLAGVGAGLGLAGESSRMQAQATPQTPAAVPDAPRPQSLPNLNTLTPAAPAVPGTPAAGSAASPATLPDTPVPSTLPSAPSAAAGAQDADNADVFVPPAGDGPKTIIRVPVTFVEVPFLVKDSRGQNVPGLTPRDIQVYENGLRQRLAFFTSDPFPLSVALVIDQSVTFDTMERINASLAALQGAFTPYDEIAVFTYNNGVTMQDPIGFDAAESPRLTAILERSKGKGRETNMNFGGPLAQTTLINNQQVSPETTPIRGQTSVYQYDPREIHTLNDAILAAAIEVTKVPGGRRRVVYVISDGKEYGSKAKEHDVIKYLQTNKISLYATVVGDSSIPVVGFLDRIHLPLTMRDNVLPRYTSATGGELDLEFRQKGIETSFAKIARDVRTEYTAGFYSRIPPLNESARSLEVRVLRPNLTVTSKERYYPSARDSRPTTVNPAIAPPAGTPPAASSAPGASTGPESKPSSTPDSTPNFTESPSHQL